MDRWVLCGYDMEENSGDGLRRPQNCPSVNNMGSYARQKQRYCQTQKISLKEKKPYINVEQKVHPLMQRQRVVSLEKRIQDRLFKKSSPSNYHLEKYYQKIVFQPTIPQLKEFKRIDPHPEDKKNWNMGLAEVKENKRVLFSQKITINYTNSNNHVSSNPDIYQIGKGTNFKEIQTSTRTRSSTIKTNNFDFELKRPDTFIISGNRFLGKANSSEIIGKPSIEEICLKQTKNLDQMRFCRKAQSLADSEEFEEQFSFVVDKLEDYGMKGSLMKEPSTPNTVSSEYFSFGM